MLMAVYIHFVKSLMILFELLVKHMEFIDQEWSPLPGLNQIYFLTMVLPQVRLKKLESLSSEKRIPPPPSLERGSTKQEVKKK